MAQRARGRARKSGRARGRATVAHAGATVARPRALSRDTPACAPLGEAPRVAPGFFAAARPAGLRSTLCGSEHGRVPPASTSPGARSALASACDSGASPSLAMVIDACLPSATGAAADARRRGAGSPLGLGAAQAVPAGAARALKRPLPALPLLASPRRGSRRALSHPAWRSLRTRRANFVGSHEQQSLLQTTVG